MRLKVFSLRSGMEVHAMSFRSLRLPALMAGAAAAVVSFATPSFAWYSHARHSYRTTHHVVVHRTVYRPAPSYPWAPGAVIATILGGVDIGGAGEQASDIIGPYDCAYGYPIADNGGRIARHTAITRPATGIPARAKQSISRTGPYRFSSYTYDYNPHAERW